MFTILDGMSGYVCVSMCAYVHVQAQGQPQALQLVSCSLAALEFTWVGLARWPVSLRECSVFTYPELGL